MISEFCVQTPRLPRARTAREGVKLAGSLVERFGYVDGQMIPAFGEITSRSLVAQAVRRVSEGEDARTVADDVASQMRDVIN